MRRFRCDTCEKINRMWEEVALLERGIPETAPSERDEIMSRIETIRKEIYDTEYHWCTEGES